MGRDDKIALLDEVQRTERRQNIRRPVVAGQRRARRMARQNRPAIDQTDARILIWAGWSEVLKQQMN